VGFNVRKGVTLIGSRNFLWWMAPVVVAVGYVRHDKKPEGILEDREANGKRRSSVRKSLGYFTAKQ